MLSELAWRKYPSLFQKIYCQNSSEQRWKDCGELDQSENPRVCVSISAIFYWIYINNFICVSIEGYVLKLNYQTKEKINAKK